MGPVATVSNSKGGPEMQQYIWSDYLKKGGVSFADHYKNLIETNAPQIEVQSLAKEQEAMANREGEKDRSPNTIAKTGGMKKYLNGGVKMYKTAGAVEDPPNVNTITKAQWLALDKYDRWKLVYDAAKSYGDKFQIGRAHV